MSNLWFGKKNKDTTQKNTIFGFGIFGNYDKKEAPDESLLKDEEVINKQDEGLSKEVDADDEQIENNKAVEVLDLIKVTPEEDKDKKAIIIDKMLTIKDSDLKKIIAYDKDSLSKMSEFIQGYLNGVIKDVNDLITKSEGVKFKGISNATVEKKHGLKLKIWESFSTYTETTGFASAQSVRETFTEVYENFKNVTNIEKIHSEMIKLMMFLNRLNPSIMAVLAEGIRNDILNLTKDIKGTKNNIKKLANSGKEADGQAEELALTLYDQEGRLNVLEGISGQISAIGDIAAKVDIEVAKNKEQQEQLDKEAELNRQQQTKLDEQEKAIKEEAELNRQQQTKLDEHAETINRARTVIKEKVGSIESTLEKEAKLNKLQEEAIAKEAELNRQQQAFIDEVDKLIKDRKSLVGRLKIYLPAYLGLACGVIALSLHFIKI